MKKKLLILFLCFSVLSVLSACGKKNETATTEPGAADSQYVTVVDENGEVVTDEAGEPLTVPAALPENGAQSPDEAPPEDAPIIGGPEEDGSVIDLPPAEPETPVERFNNALLDRFTDEQKSSQWFSAFGTDDGNGGVTVMISMAQDGSDDAYALAKSYYDTVRQTAQEAGLSLSSYEFTVLKEGVTVGVYTTTDGASYNALVNGETLTLN